MSTDMLHPSIHPSDAEAIAANPCAIPGQCRNPDSSGPRV